MDERSRPPSQHKKGKIVMRSWLSELKQGFNKEEQGTHKPEAVAARETKILKDASRDIQHTVYDPTVGQDLYVAFFDMSRHTAERFVLRKRLQLRWLVVQYSTQRSIPSYNIPSKPWIAFLFPVASD